MPSFETLFIVLLAAVAAIGVGALAAVLRRPRTGTASEALGRGDFETALARGGASEERNERLAAAVAARHLLDLERAAELVGRVLAEDDGDGEAWLERGLVAAYAGQREAAEAAWSRAERRRADLLESLTLHRAWLALAEGDVGRALSLFEEVEAPLEGKLREDLGSGEPVFADWFLHAAALWRAAGQPDKARWAAAEAVASAPGSRIVAAFVAEADSR